MEKSFLSTRRRLLGLTQRELARRSGVKQPLISAIESGRRDATPPVALALGKALSIRPSLALRSLRTDVLRIVRDNHGLEAHVFGSVARGEDQPGSDIDLMVEFDEQADITDLLAMEEALGELLTVPVDVVSAGSSSHIVAAARQETVPL